MMAKGLAPANRVIVQVIKYGGRKEKKEMGEEGKKRK